MWYTMILAVSSVCSASLRAASVIVRNDDISHSLLSVAHTLALPALSNTDKRSETRYGKLVAAISTCSSIVKIASILVQDDKISHDLLCIAYAAAAPALLDTCEYAAREFSKEGKKD